MKNIHVLPTDKLSKLVKRNLGLIRVADNFTKSDLDFILAEFVNIYITSDEEIKEGDWIYDASEMSVVKYPQIIPKPNYFTQFCKKIILTDNKDLINDGVQAIDDEFLEWFVKNPSCEIVETKLVEFEVDMGLGEECVEYSSYYKIIIPKEEPKFETLEEVAEIWVNNRFTKQIKDEDIYASKSSIIESHILFTKWQQERSYSEEDMEKAFMEGHNIYGCVTDNIDEAKECFNEWFEQFKNK